MLDIATRRKQCEDTIVRSRAVAHETSGGSLESEFVAAQLPPLDKTDPKYPNFTKRAVEIYNSDAFALTRSFKPSAGKIGVLNLASDREPGGGWRYTLSATQEEALCYSSTLYNTLKPEWYPWANLGEGSCAGILSPGVVVFKDTLDNNLADLPLQERHVVSVLTIAAPCLPDLAPDGETLSNASDLHDLREKIMLILRLAASSGITSLVLGAMGCGAYGCPPRLVAREMKAIIETEEFDGWFEHIMFAVYAAGPTGRRNLEVFQEVFGQS